jgi:hypothetical protein
VRLGVQFPAVRNLVGATYRVCINKIDIKI